MSNFSIKAGILALLVFGVEAAVAADEGQDESQPEEEEPLSEREPNELTTQQLERQVERHPNEKNISVSGRGPGYPPKRSGNMPRDPRERIKDTRGEMTQPHATTR